MKPFIPALSLFLCTCFVALSAAQAQDAYVPSDAQIQNAVDSLLANWKQQQTQTLLPKAKYNNAQLQIWASLDQAQLQGTALKMIVNPKSADEVNVSIDWLYDQILNHNANGVYEYVYAGLVFQAAGTQYPVATVQAQAMFMAANLAMRVDGARCLDSSAAQVAIQRQWGSSIVTPVMKSIDGVDENKRFKLRLNAAALEKLRGPREAQPWICQYGNQALMSAIAKGAVTSASGQKQADGSNQVAVDTSTSQLNLVDDATFLARRDQLLAGSQTPRTKPP